jgi:hypothetical protein
MFLTTKKDASYIDFRVVSKILLTSDSRVVDGRIRRVFRGGIKFDFRHVIVLVWSSLIVTTHLTGRCVLNRAKDMRFCF